MNMDKFLDRLANLKDLEWELRDDKLRCQFNKQNCCPITAIANMQEKYRMSPFRISDTRVAARAINLDDAARLEIVRAADKLWREGYHQYDKALREKLLEATGVQILSTH